MDELEGLAWCYEGISLQSRVVWIRTYSDLHFSKMAVGFGRGYSYSDAKMVMTILRVWYEVDMKGYGRADR